MLAAIAIGLAFASAPSCVVSPQPSPPTIDGDLIGSDGTEAVNDLVIFKGEPGAVDPAEGVVVITNLETADAPSIAPVQDDGSFEIGVPGSTLDEFRLQVVADEVRSEPLDLVHDPVGPGFQRTEHAFDACLTLAPPLFIALDGPGDARSIIVRNDCEATLTFAPPRLRRGLASFTFSPTQGFDLEPGDTRAITVRATALTDEREDILYLEVAGEVTDRRPITIALPPN